MKMLAIIALLALAATPSARAASTDLPTDLRDRHVDTTVDVGTLLEMAERGDSRAAFLLGTRYASGRGGVRDDSQAVRWFRMAADRGLAEAQFNLGIMYANGRGVARDQVEAARWYRLAAEQGLAQAQFNLGTLYGTGTGVQRDEGLALKWLRRAADHQLPEAQYNLGALYEYGRGVRVDARAAMVWYKRAAESGYEPASKRLKALMARLHVSEVPDYLYDTPRAKPDAASTAAPAPAAGAASSASAGETASAAAGTAGKPATVAASEPAQPGPLAGSDWVAALDPDHYTLQVLSDTNEATVRRFVARHFEPGEAGYFATRRDGKVWYSVVWGDFGDYDIAKGAIRHLPRELRAAKPWVRKVRLIQQSMLAR